VRAYYLLPTVPAPLWALACCARSTLERWSASLLECGDLERGFARVRSDHC